MILPDHITYSDELLQKAVAFIENLMITTGLHRGRKLKLRPWQVEFVRDALCRVYTDGSGRSTRRAVLSMGRKNGKTELAAAIVLLFLVHQDFGEPNGEIYSGAKTRDQAGNLFKAVVKFIRASKTLSKHLVIQTSLKRIYVRGNSLTTAGSFYQALSSDGKSAHGMNPSFVIYDELAQVDNTEAGLELYDALTTGFGGRANPLFLAISTQSDDPAHILSEIIRDGLGLDANGNPLEEPDPTVVTHLYTAEAGCSVDDEKAMKDANPAYGDFLNARQMALDAAEALRSPSAETRFRLRNLNQQVSKCAPLIRTDDWRRCIPNFFDTYREATDFEEGEEIYLGLDMSQQTDLTALVAVSKNALIRAGLDREAVLTRSWFWKPSAVMKEHGSKDGQDYVRHLSNGWMLPCPGRVIDYEVIAKQIFELSKKYKIVGMAYDRYNTKYLMVELKKLFPVDEKGDIVGFKLMDHAQTFRDSGAAVNALEAIILKDGLITDSNPLLSWCMFNATVATDTSNNRKLIKNRPTARIDGAVALAMALNMRSLELMEEEEHHTPWDDPSFEVMVA